MWVWMVVAAGMSVVVAGHGKGNDDYCCIGSLLSRVWDQVLISLLWWKGC